MPPQPYVDRWIRLAVRLSQSGQNLIYGFNYLGPAGRPTETQLTALCSSFWSNFGATIASMHGAQTTAMLVEATDRYAEGGAYGSFVPVVDRIGTKAGDALPANCAICVSWKTGLSGRSYHGRSYIGGLVDNDMVGSVITSANLTLLSNWAQAMITYAGTVGIAVDLVVLSLKHETMQSINGYAIDNTGDSQRRRLPGRGF
jgi:hypothetical protein